MSNLILPVIPLPTVQHTLQGLLATYLTEKAESQRDEDIHDTAYWDSACQTVYDVAAALGVTVEGDSGVPLDTSVISPTSEA